MTLKIRGLLSYRAWKMWMSDNMHITLLTLFYIMLMGVSINLLDSLILISSIGFYLVYGFLINDFFDMPYDIAAGKKRPVHKLPKTVFLGIIFSITLISALHLLYLKTFLYTTTYIASYILATLYSAPPVRFKDRGISGVVVDALIEKTLPLVVIFAFFNYFKPDALLFLITAFTIQAFAITRHQIQDFDADSKTGIHSAVVDVGFEKVSKTFKNFLCPITGIAMLTLCIFVCVKIPLIILPTAVILIFNVSFSYLISTGRISRKEKLSPLYISCLYVCIIYAFPLILAFLLSLQSRSNIILLLVTLTSQYYVIKQVIESLRNKSSLLEDYVVDR